MNHFFLRSLQALALGAAFPTALIAADGYFDMGFALGSGYFAFPGDGTPDSSSAA